MLRHIYTQANVSPLLLPPPPPLNTAPPPPPISLQHSPAPATTHLAAFCIKVDPTSLHLCPLLFPLLLPPAQMQPSQGMQLIRVKSMKVGDSASVWQAPPTSQHTLLFSRSVPPTSQHHRSSLPSATSPNPLPQTPSSATPLLTLMICSQASSANGRRRRAPGIRSCGLRPHRHASRTRRFAFLR